MDKKQIIMASYSGQWRNSVHLPFAFRMPIKNFNKHDLRNFTFIVINNYFYIIIGNIKYSISFKL
jgi:hypothetical protein